MLERAIVLSVQPNMNPHNKERNNAIGYLSVWGNPDKVEIFESKDGELTARYYRIDPATKEAKFFFIMAGILHTDGTYSFHS